MYVDPTDEPIDDTGLQHMWPLDVALGALGAIALVVTIQNFHFDDPRWLYNAWTYVIGVVVGVLLLDLVLRKIASRFVQRSMQLGFLVSVLIHLSMLMMGLHVVLFHKIWPVQQIGKRTNPLAVSRVVPQHYFEQTVSLEKRKYDWQAPVESPAEEHDTPDPEQKDQQLDAAKPDLSLPDEPEVQVKPPEQALAPKQQLQELLPQPSEQSLQFDRQASDVQLPQPTSEPAAVPELQAPVVPDVRLESRAADVAATSTDAAPLSLPNQQPSLQPLTPAEMAQAAPAKRADAAPLPEVASVDRPLQRQDNSRATYPSMATMTLPEAPALNLGRGQPQANASELSPAMRSDPTGRFSQATGADVPLSQGGLSAAPFPNPATGGAAASYARSSGSMAGDQPAVASATIGNPLSRRGPVSAGVTGSTPAALVPVPGVASVSGGETTATMAPVGDQIGRSQRSSDALAGPMLAGPASIGDPGLPGQMAEVGPIKRGLTGTGDQPNPLSMARSESLQRRNLDSVGGSSAANTKAAIPFRRRLMRTAEGGAPQEPGQAGPQTEEAIEMGLRFLASQQNPDGSWSLQATDPSVLLHSDTAATGLCLLAFQGAGYTHRQHQYARTCDRALDWLIAHQSEDGNLFKNEDETSNRNVWLYSHGVASLALCEAYGMTQDPRLQEPAQKALDFIAYSQNPTRGGWRYQPQESSDTSVSGWMVMALKSGELAGLTVQPSTYEGVRKWLDLSRSERGQPYLYRYNPYAPDTPTQKHGRDVTASMTSVGLLMQMYLGWRRDNPQLRAGAEWLLERLPDNGTPTHPQRDSYYWYYATQVMFHMGDDYWRKWNASLSPLLIDTQVRDGDAKGSWDPKKPVPDRWGDHAGRLYVTALNLLNLEIYYRHLPIYEETAR